MGILEGAGGLRRRLFLVMVMMAVASLVVCPVPANAAEAWVLPTTGTQHGAVVVQKFAPPRHRWLAGHRGVDLLATRGGVIRAAGPGVVSFAAVVADREVVVVRHLDGTRTTYEPVSARLHVGARVGAGTPLGVISDAATHCHPAVCLHWGWSRGTTYLDPLVLVGSRPQVRLLPIWASHPPDAPRSSFQGRERAASADARHGHVRRDHVQGETEQHEQRSWSLTNASARVAEWWLPWAAVAAVWLIGWRLIGWRLIRQTQRTRFRISRVGRPAAQLPTGRSPPGRCTPELTPAEIPARTRS